MSQAIKSISLDDVGETRIAESAVAAPPAALSYSPQHVTGTSVSDTSLGKGDFGSRSALKENTIGGTQFGTAMTRMTDFFGSGDDGRKAKIYTLAGILLLVLVISAYFMFNDMLSIPGLNGFGTNSENSVEIVPELLMEKASTNSKASSVNEAARVAEILTNPYWSLPNPLEFDKEKISNSGLSQSQEERWRQSLAHPYSYQRYKTAENIRKARVMGSEYLLTDILSQPKFWTRMTALLALAEIGQELDIDVVEGAIGNTRRPLVANYFRRFRLKASPSEIYVMRLAIRVVDASSREVIIHNMARRRTPTNDLYLVAASHDPNEKIKATADAYLNAAPASAEVLKEFNKIIDGESQIPAMPSDPSLTEGDKTSSGIQGLEIPSSVPVEEVNFLNEEVKSAIPVSAPEAIPEDSEEEMDGVPNEEVPAAT